jgi:hypothetical protein
MKIRKKTEKIRKKNRKNIFVTKMPVAVPTLNSGTGTS